MNGLAGTCCIRSSHEPFGPSLSQSWNSWRPALGAPPLTAFVRLYQLLFERRDPKTIVATMESLVMAPRSTATLYELYVAFRLVNEFENLGMVRRRPWRLLGDTAPVAVLDGGTTTVVIHWQRSLQALAKRVPSLAQQVARANGLRVGPLRPDIVVEMKSGESVRIDFGEVKYYTRPPRGSRLRCWKAWHTSRMRKTFSATTPPIHSDLRSSPASKRSLIRQSSLLALTGRCIASPRCSLRPAALQSLMADV